MYSAPFEVCLNITSSCNLSCKHCLNRNLPNCEPDLSTAELLRVIDQLAEAKVFKVNIFGGEPLVHPDFFLVVEHLNKYPLQLSLNTNGTLIDRSIAKWLKQHKIKNIAVSFDGSKQEVMDKTRGEGTFKKNIKGIESLLAEGVSVLLSATLTKINYKDVKGMVLLAKELKANTIRFNHVFFAGNAACFIKQVYLSPDEELEAINEVCRANEEFPDFIYKTSTYLCQKEKLNQMKHYQPTRDKIVVSPCGAAGNKCNIRPDGWVTPCELIWDVKCGNLKQQTLVDIWQNSQQMNEFRRPMEINLDDLPECKSCQYQYICFIGHRCYPYYYPGGVKDRSLYCWLNETQTQLKDNVIKL
ncbi:MAG: radical SAM protein [Candidatus Omnitrophota bacterium]|nr:radical SAM protein [Candidatus Omnitrophota bacterium]